MARRTAEADALEGLLEGRTSADDTTRSLSRLAGLATTVRDHSELEAPTDEFRTRLRAELLEVAAAGRATLWERTQDRVDEATAGLRHSLRTAGAAALASTLIATTGVAAAAQSALPGDVLYSVKDVTEDARVALASGDVERGRLHLDLARERVEEVEHGRDRLSPDTLTATLDRLDIEAATGAEKLLEAAASDQALGGLLDEVDDFTAEVRGRLLEVSPHLPLSVRPATERSLEVLRRIDLQLAGLFDLATCEGCADSTSPGRRIVLPGDGPAAPFCRCVRPGAANPDADEADDAETTDDGDDPAPLERPQTSPTEPSLLPGGERAPRERPERGGEVVDDLGSAVDDVVDDVATDVQEPLDDVGSIVDDLLDPDTTSTSDVTGKVGRLGDTVEDTASDVGGVVDDRGDGLLD